MTDRPLRIGRRTHNFPSITDREVWDASQKWYPEHEDAPTAFELAQLREIIAKHKGVNLDWLCLHWLRNTYVQVRKAGRRK